MSPMCGPSHAAARFRFARRKRTQTHGHVGSEVPFRVPSAASRRLYYLRTGLELIRELLSG
jgi:hypothetical protein